MYMESVSQNIKKRTVKKARKLKLIERPSTLKKSPEKPKPNLSVSPKGSIRKKSKESSPKKLKQISSTSQGKPTPITEKNMTFTIKRPKLKKPRKLKIVDSDLKPTEPDKAMVPKRLNELFIDVLGELHTIMMGQGEPFRARAYQKAQESIMTYEKDITDPKQVQGLQGIGKTIMSKLEEYANTGTLRVLERERGNPLNKLTKIYGVGPKKGKELIEQGVLSLEDLKEKQHLLNDTQIIGLKYYDDIEARIPRDEIDKYKERLSTIFKDSTPEGSSFEIVGSYRRGVKNSGDIDIIVTNDKDNKKAFNDFIDRLIKDKILIEVLTRGKTKSMTIAQLPGMRPRRVDFLYTSPAEYAFAILYFTGSKIFNTVQRQRALDLGYSLNEHGLYKMVQGKKGARIDGDFPTEESIFDFLEMKFKAPKDRIDGRSVQIKTPSENVVITKPNEKSPPKAESPSPAPKILKIRRTLKKKKLVEKDNIAGFKKEGISYLKPLTESELSKMIRDANDGYYCNNKPIMTDNEYDILREYTMKKHPKNKAALEGHTECNIAVEKSKVALPYQMWSMDKIKPDTGALAKWMLKYSGPYTLSCKLDGVSGLYSTEGAAPKLYTRGNGVVGQDVSHMIPYLQLPKTKDIVIRGEFIIPKERFQEKYAGKFANPRNFVAGVVNRKSVDAEKFRDLDFVAYEVIKPILKPSEQMTFLMNQDVEVVRNVTKTSVTNELLSELLVAWRNDYKYEIDGVICINDANYPRKKGNPEHAFAFKMVLSDQIAEAKVLDVIWTPSKDGYLKPRVQIDPVVLGGARIEYATGFNAKFIEDNKIGVGALIKLIRSGDVIPHIVSVIQPAEKPQLPNVPYTWNETHVDIILDNKEEDDIVKGKTITGFFRGIGVVGLSSGNIQRIINAGFDSVSKIIAMTKADFLTIEGFKHKLAMKLSEGIKEKIKEASLPEIVHATNVFGRGFGTKKLKAILDLYPKILDPNEPYLSKMDKLLSVPGMAKKSSEKFIGEVQELNDFMNEAHLEEKLNYAPKETIVDESHPLYGKKWIMTGFRDKDLIEKLKTAGAEQGSSVNSKTFVVLVKDINEDTGKAEEARKLGIPLMTVKQFEEMYKI
jgi:DNA ligase (NAD+)